MALALVLAVHARTLTLWLRLVFFLPSRFLLLAVFAVYVFTFQDSILLRALLHQPGPELSERPVFSLEMARTAQRIAGGFAAPADFAALHADLTDAVCRAQRAENREVVREWEMGQELAQTRTALSEALQGKAAASQSCGEVEALMLQQCELAKRARGSKNNHSTGLCLGPTQRP